MLDSPEIFNRLRQDHIAARRVMAALEAEVDRVAQFHPPNLAPIGRAVSFFTGHMAEMHHQIEDMIFAALSRETSAKAAELRKIAEEHDAAGALVTHLSEVAAELATDAARARTAFCGIARDLIAFTHHHLRREESQFLIYADEHLTPGARHDITIAARALERTLAEKAGAEKAGADESRWVRSPR